MLETFQVADEIERCNKAIERLCKELKGVGQEKAETKVEYDKELAKALACLAEENVPVTTREKIAKGFLAEAGVTLRYELAEVNYKAAYARLSAAQSVLNGWQSYNRYLSTGVE